MNIRMILPTVVIDFPNSKACLIEEWSIGTQQIMSTTITTILIGLTNDAIQTYRISHEYVSKVRNESAHSHFYTGITTH